MTDQESEDKKWFKIVDKVAGSSTCLHRQVGAVLIRDNMLIASGSNKSPIGVTSCQEEGTCYKPSSSTEGQNNDVCLAVHAEMDIISKCAEVGISTNNATLYCNYKPCFSCLKVLVNSGVREIVYKEDYECPCPELYEKVVEESGIKLRKANC